MKTSIYAWSKYYTLHDVQSVRYTFTAHPHFYHRMLMIIVTVRLDHSLHKCFLVFSVTYRPKTICDYWYQIFKKAWFSKAASDVNVKNVQNIISYYRVQTNKHEKYSLRIIFWKRILTSIEKIQQMDPYILEKCFKNKGEKVYK